MPTFPRRCRSSAESSELPPASILTVEQGAEPLSEPPEPGVFARGVGLKSYWSYSDVIEAGLDDPIEDDDEAIEELEIALSRAIAAQALADVPVGAFLSGGIDSSTIVALYQKYSSVPVKTFTIGFSEQGYNEADYARAVARHFGTDHHERIVTPSDALDVIPLLPRIYDEPFADPSQIPTYLVSAFAREKVTVALSGDGGDELFGGYTRYSSLARAWSVMKAGRGLARPVARLLGHVPAPALSFAASLARRRRQMPEFGAKARRTLGLLGRSKTLDELMTAFLDPWSAGSPVLGGESRGLGKLDLEPGGRGGSALRMMHADALSYLPDDVLTKVDRASMAVGSRGARALPRSSGRRGRRAASDAAQGLPRAGQADPSPAARPRGPG